MEPTNGPSGSNWTWTQYGKPGRRSYISVPSQIPLLEDTIGDLINHNATRYPESPAIVVSTPTEIRKSFQELKTEVDNLAAGLLKIGLRKGDRLGIWGPNSYEWYLTFLAGAKCGLIVVNLNPACKPRELEYCINKVGVKCMVIADPFKTSDYYAMILEMCSEVETSDGCNINAKAFPELTTLITMSPNPRKGALTLEQVIQKGSTSKALRELEKVEREVQFDDICNIVFTSGTTGNPKGVMISHHRVVNSAYVTCKRCGFTHHDKLCLPIPLFHVMGSVLGVLAALHCGAAVVFPSPGFCASAALKAISREGCTAIYGTPTMHIDILHAPDFEQYNVSSLNWAVTGGAICPEELVRIMKANYTVQNVTILYGLTETCGAVFQSLDHDTDALRAETVGYPVEHVEVKVVDEDGKIVDIGEKGELCIRGYCIMQGYWEDEEKSKEAIDQSRWFHTGDLAIMRESGHARIVGRFKDMIIRGGENICPREIEDFLHTHPGVQEVQVVSVPDVRMGEETCAWVKLRENVELSDNELKEFCRGKIAHYKVPKYVRFVTEFPKTTSGKIQKYKMRETMVKDLGMRG